MQPQTSLGLFYRLTGGTGDMAEAQAKNADPSIVSPFELMKTSTTGVLATTSVRCCLQINKLLGLYEQQTGSSFGGSDAEYSILSKLVQVLWLAMP